MDNNKVGEGSIQLTVKRDIQLMLLFDRNLDQSKREKVAFILYLAEKNIYQRRHFNCQ